jgi:hypothetical protein
MTKKLSSLLLFPQPKILSRSMRGVHEQLSTAIFDEFVDENRILNNNDNVTHSPKIEHCAAPCSGYLNKKSPKKS